MSLTTFPKNPTLNQVFTLAGKTFRWNGRTWSAQVTYTAGATGISGNVGATGATGIQGNVGPQGATGLTGSPGSAGAQGATGITGATGAPGAAGSPGPAGAGYDGATTSTGYFDIPLGTTAQRPVSPPEGATRINSSNSFLEVYYSGTWVSAVNLTPFSATGGTLSTATVNGVNYRVHTFTTSGTFTVTAGTTNAEIVMIGGGGSGGVDCGGGAGGGGLIDTSKTFNISDSTLAYPIVIGAGAAARAGSADDGPGNNGGNTTGFGLTALGGSGGTGWSGGGLPPGSSTYSGGCGGGQSYGTGMGPAGAGTATQPTSASGGYGYGGGTASAGRAGGGGGAGGFPSNFR